MEAVLNVFVEWKVADICIGLIGVFGLAVMTERFKALYFDYSLPAEPFMKQVMRLVEQDKIEEAITFCSANDKKPLAYVVKRILERSDRDEKSVHHALGTAASEIAPKLVRRLGYISMISNTVTLVGLLGTVIGLIVAFKAISFADPTQKQTILAQGISIAMTATASALLVAIPMMFAYSFLYEKQNRLFSEVDEYSNKIIDQLRDRAYVPFTHDGAFPTNLKADKINSGVKAPAPAKRSA
jgi:biopolymer transport protein ExbB/TolQ